MKRKLNLKPLLFLALVCLLSGALGMGASGAKATVGKATVTVGTVTQKTAAFSWSIKGSADGVLIYRYDYAKKSYSRIAVSEKTAYTAKGLEGGESYLFAVQPYIREGGSMVKGKLVKARFSTPLSAVGTIKQAETTAVSHKLKWKAVPGAEQYQIYYFKDSTKSFALLGTTKNAYCTVRKLQEASLYRYKVRAVSLCANGKTVEAKTSAVFTAYTNPGDITRFTADDVTTTGYRLEWDAVPGAQGYRIFRFDEASGKYKKLTNVQGTSYQIDSLSPCSTAYYKICSYAKLLGKVRFGARTAALSLTTKPETVTPYLVAGPAVNGMMKVGWEKGVCDGYLVFGAETEEGPYQLLEQVDGPDTLSCSIRSPFEAETLYVRVKTYITVDQTAILSAYSDALMIE